MIETQETNLPIEESIASDEAGKLEASKTPEENPVATASEAVEIPDVPDSEAEVNQEDTSSEVESIPFETAPETDDVTEESASADELIPDDSPPAEEEVPEEPAPEDEEVPEEPAPEVKIVTKQDIILRLQQINEEPKKNIRNEVDTLKQAYYRLRRAEVEAKKKEFLEGGGEEAEFVLPDDETEVPFKSLINEYKEKRAVITADEERQKESNLILKQHLIERLKILTESQDDFSRRYNEFRDIQRKWKEIKLVPQEYSKELWRSYQLYNERFYDIVKINNQFRDYDFKKNLEMKTVLCETVERLSTEKDVVSAFHQLQKLHQQWREIGPVAKEYRESIWDRFKDASALINKNHQQHFDNLRGQEERNLAQKEEICKALEEMDTSLLKTMKDWEKKTEEVMALQARWKKIGFTARKQNAKIFDRFRVASDNYFNKKSEFFKTIKKEIDQNIELKKALVEKAEAMKTSTDWKETTKAFVEIQSEWKTIGTIGRKYTETLWKQFIAACDYFFEQKSKDSSSHKSEEQENLEAKRALIEKIQLIDQKLTDDQALTLLRGYLAEWNTIGYVPFKEKDKLHKAFREVVDKQFDRLKVNEQDRRVQQYRSNLTEMMGSGKNKLYNERDKLMRTFDRMKNELQTYENNIGFISSKGGDGLLKEIDRKITRLKEDMEIVVKKIEAIDENLD